MAQRTSIRSLVDPLKLEGKNINAFIVNEYISNGFSSVSVVKNLPANAGAADSIPGSGRFPGEGNGTPLQYSCLENPMDGGAW